MRTRRERGASRTRGCKEGINANTLFNYLSEIIILPLINKIIKKEFKLYNVIYRRNCEAFFNGSHEYKLIKIVLRKNKGEVRINRVDPPKSSMAKFTNARRRPLPSLSRIRIT